jgi:hypothetical protein
MRLILYLIATLTTIACSSPTSSVTIPDNAIVVELDGATVWASVDYPAHDTPRTAKSGQIAYGDVSGNGEINAYDASLVLRYIVLLDADIDSVAANVSGEAGVTSYDAALILRKIIDPSMIFPVEDFAYPL